MNIIIPGAFCEVTEDLFKVLLASVNWTREAYADGEQYIVRGERVGVHRQGRWFFAQKYIDALPVEEAK